MPRSRGTPARRCGHPVASEEHEQAPDKHERGQHHRRDPEHQNTTVRAGCRVTGFVRPPRPSSSPRVRDAGARLVRSSSCAETSRRFCQSRLDEAAHSVIHVRQRLVELGRELRSAGAASDRVHDEPLASPDAGLCRHAPQRRERARPCLENLNDARAAGRGDFQRPVSQRPHPRRGPRVQR